jgi:hypothetical protein
MQHLYLQTLIGDSQLCISKTSLPGQRCIEPLQVVPDEYDTFNSSYDISLEYFYAYIEEVYASYSYEADAQSPFSADAQSPFLAAAPSPLSADAPSQSNTSALPEDDTLCVIMACSAEGRVLVNGKLCDPGAPFPNIYSAFRCQIQQIYKLDASSKHERLACMHSHVLLILNSTIQTRWTQVQR